MQKSRLSYYAGIFAYTTSFCPTAAGVFSSKLPFVITHSTQNNMTFWDLFFPVGPDISMAAFMGTTAWLLLGKKMDKTHMVMTVVANYLISIYMTGLVAEITGWKSLTGIAFVIATGGLKFVERIIDQLFEKITNNIKGNNGTDTNNTSQ